MGNLLAPLALAAMLLLAGCTVNINMPGGDSDGNESTEPDGASSIPSPDSDTKDSPERVSVRASAQDFDNDSARDWVVVTITEGENAPYSRSEVQISLQPEGQAPMEHLGCWSPEAHDGACTGPWDGSQGKSWHVGASLYLPCHDSSTHALDVRVAQTQVLKSFNVRCGQRAAGW